MAGVIDTNILLYAANRNAEEHSAAVSFLADAMGGTEPWFLTEGILYEFMRVSTHPKVFEKPLAWKEGLRFIRPLLMSRRLDMLTAGENHWTILERVLGDLHRPSGNLLFDIRTGVLMRERGVREIYTTDTDFLQFREIQAINPLK
jgi:toxin-antitoxin system PIN domain toxin